MCTKKEAITDKALEIWKPKNTSILWIPKKRQAVKKRLHGKKVSIRQYKKIYLRNPWEKVCEKIKNKWEKINGGVNT